jgi:glycosidase
MRLTESPSTGLLPLLRDLYGPQVTEQLMRDLERVMAGRAPPAAIPPVPFTEHDSFLITYPDQVRAPGITPLEALDRYLARWVGPLFNGVHILPFYPASSDDGFSVIDYGEVDPSLGSWDDIEHIAGQFRLMVDAVINHVSAQSPWMDAYRRGDLQAARFFIEVSPDTDLSKVVRPRDLPLLTPVETVEGRRLLWTTFSPDQIDLNYAEPKVLLAVLQALLGYVQHGARYIRLDAVAYLWKTPGTSCIHLPQTHALVRLMRAVLDHYAPGVRLISETNVPQSDNLSYFGDGDEVNLVYQFPLPPLILHTFHTGDAAALSAWAGQLPQPAPGTTYFNFLASHDGIGLNPARDLLTAAAFERLIEETKARGGQVSYKAGPGGSRIPYELNINYLDALTEPGEWESRPARAVQRFLCAHAILLALQGVPAVYVHSLFGSRGDDQAARLSGRPRAVNRAKWQLAAIEQALADGRSRRRLIYDGIRQLMKVRRTQAAFSPVAPQRILDLGPAAFGLLRLPASAPPVACLHDVAGTGSAANLAPWLAADIGIDLLTGEKVSLAEVNLAAYQVRWLTPSPNEKVG